jgi:hypothetical protein
MSRHQAYRNYDYENDLDEYDGGEDDYVEEEQGLSTEDKGMRALKSKIVGYCTMIPIR